MTRREGTMKPEDDVRQEKYKPAVELLVRGFSWEYAAARIGVSQSSLRQVMAGVHPNPPPRRKRTSHLTRATDPMG